MVPTWTAEEPSYTRETFSAKHHHRHWRLSGVHFTSPAIVLFTRTDGGSLMRINVSRPVRSLLTCGAVPQRTVASRTNNLPRTEPRSGSYDLCKPINAAVRYVGSCNDAADRGELEGEGRRTRGPLTPHWLTHSNSLQSLAGHCCNPSYPLPSPPPLLSSHSAPTASL